MITYSIVIVDDEPSARSGITMALRDDYDARGFASAEEALAAMKAGPPDLVLLDIGLPGMSGIDALKAIKRACADTLVIMITAYEDIQTVITAMKQGAYDYVVKPIHMETLLVTIRNALETIRLHKEVQALQEQQLAEHIPCFIGRSKSIRNVIDFVDQVAKSPDTPIMIYGETGTGKELIASSIHYKSPNFKGPFVTINCAAIPRELLESELFGYERGAFSGASESGKKGMVEKAAGGTLFLDEVGDLSMEAQAKLLRFLEDGEYYRVGGTQKLRAAARVVAATNKDLEELIAKGRFRRDLFYRLAVIKVEIPELTKRADDIVPIAKHFLLEFSHKFNKNFSGITAGAREALLNYDWKGNIRELRNTIERGTLTGTGPELTLADIALPKAQSRNPEARDSNSGSGEAIPAEGMDLTRLLQDTERRYIRRALEQAAGNESRAARLLNMNYYTFRHRRKKLF